MPQFSVTVVTPSVELLVNALTVESDLRMTSRDGMVPSVYISITLSLFLAMQTITSCVVMHMRQRDNSLHWMHPFDERANNIDLPAII